MKSQHIGGELRTTRWYADEIVFKSRARPAQPSIKETARLERMGGMGGRWWWWEGGCSPGRTHLLEFNIPELHPALGQAGVAPGRLTGRVWARPVIPGLTGRSKQCTRPDLHQVYKRLQEADSCDIYLKLILVVQHRDRQNGDRVNSKAKVFQGSKRSPSESLKTYWICLETLNTT